MKTALQIFSWVAVGIGFLAIFGSLGTVDGEYGVVGGALYLIQGILALAYISEKEKK